MSKDSARAAEAAAELEGRAMLLDQQLRHAAGSAEARPGRIHPLRYRRVVVSKPGPRPRFIPSAKVPLLQAEKLAARQTARSGTSPFDRQPVPDLDTRGAVSCTADGCGRRYLSEAFLQAHTEDAHTAEDNASARRRQRSRRTQTF